MLVYSNWQEEVLMDAVVSEAGRFDWEIMDRRFLHEKAVADFDPDGVLVCRYGRLVQEDWPEAMGCPVVQVGGPGALQPESGLVLVAQDTTKIAQLAVAHFEERSYRMVSMVEIETASYPTGERTVTDAFGQLAEQAGIVCHPPLILADSENTLEVASQMRQWLASVPLPIGVFIPGDIMAGHFCAVCRDAGVAVPEEVAMLAMGNKRKFCKMSPCPLSSIDLNRARHGRAAVRALQRLMEGDEAAAEPVIRVAPDTVVVRKSTDMLAVADPAVARALTYIWAHLSESIVVDDVVKAAQVPRRTLEYNFRKHLGRTINQEMLRKRLELCRHLLLTTDLPVVEIAPRLGLLSKNYLHRAFRKRYGMSPKEFRQKQA